MVVLAGNAPASSGYQPGALLLSYGTVLAEATLWNVAVLNEMQWRYRVSPLQGFQSRNATLAIVRLWVSVFIMTRCQNGSMMVAWSL